MQLAPGNFGATLLVRVLMVCAILCAALSLAMAQTPAQTSAQTSAQQALAAYEEGKRLYDDEDYEGARSQFNKAIRFEPGNPRWYYNMGLTHRQMGNFQAARQSLLKARVLDPEYKRAEIEQKLTSMGFDANGGGTPSHVADMPGDQERYLLPLVVVLVGSFVALAVWLSRRAASLAPRADILRQAAAPDFAAIGAIRDRLQTASANLIKIEHALRLGEDPDLRSQLDHGTRLETEARTQLRAANRGDEAALPQARRAIAELESSVTRALEQAGAVFGDQAFAAQGPNTACYFCARPLANPDFRRLVTLKRGAQLDQVLACPACAGTVQGGQSPNVLAGADGRTHWSELPGFDPYGARHGVHGSGGNAAPIPAWRFQSRRSPGELALLAAGGALAGGALASLLASPAQASSGSLLDLDAAASAGLAQDATRAAAEQAAQGRRDFGFDHS